MPVRTCTTCFVDQDDTEFRVIRQARHDKEYASRRFECKSCERSKSRSYYKGNKESVKELSRRNHLKKYGLTPESYADLLVKQEGVCAVCGSDNDGLRLHVDHCHNTGKVRGLLCNPCNRGIGLLADSPERLDAAAKYLRESG